MAKIFTGAEYLPPLWQELPAQAFTTFETAGGVKFDSAQRKDINEAAYRLTYDIERHMSRPNFSEVDARLKKLIVVLQRLSNTNLEESCSRLHELLECDGIGEVVDSLVVCPSGATLRALSAAALEERRVALLAIANALRSRLQTTYGGKTGRGADVYIDIFIASLRAIFKKAGGYPSASYSDKRSGRATPFVQLLCKVARAALECFAPFVMEEEGLRKSFPDYVRC